MMHAYDKNYLSQAQSALGRMLVPPGGTSAEFFDLFITSGVAGDFGREDFTLLAGKSGLEIAYEVLEHTVGQIEHIKPKYAANRSEEYWTGWTFASLWIK